MGTHVSDPSAMTDATRLRSHSSIRALQVEALVKHLAPIATSLDTSFVLLKGAALHLSRLVRPTDRPLNDLDVLLDPRSCRRVFDALLQQGWRALDIDQHEYHLPLLHHPRWAHLELHFALFGLSLDGRSWATFEQLSQRQLLAPLQGFADGVLIPSREVLAAHAVAHAFFLHFDSPESYPLLRCYDDLRALGWLTPDEDTFLAGPGAWLTRALPTRQVRAIIRLGRRLDLGEQVWADQPPTPESELLRHIRRGSEDPDYKTALRLRLLRHALAGPSPLVSALRRLWTSLALSSQRLESMYGPRSRMFGHAGHRAKRARDLVRMLFRSVAAWFRVHRPPPSGNSGWAGPTP